MGERLRVTKLEFGRIVIDGKKYEADLVIDGGEIKKRKKKKSKPFKDRYGHTPLTSEENIPWDCKRLVVGTGHSGALPVTEELKNRAEKKGVELLSLKTPKALEYLNEKDTNLVLHLTC
jgi:hypothetical protein